MRMPSIKCDNLKKAYDGGVYALDGVSFDLESGDFLTVIGESGGGKTTLLKCLAGLLPITAGELYINGELCNLSPVQERSVGIVFQEITLFPNMTVFENVAFALKKQKLPFDEECRLVREILGKMDLTTIQSALPKHISYGQKQKVALARAMVKKPDILLFDEPMSNIDEPSRVEYREMILDAKRSHPESIFVYVTHNVEDALTLGNKIMIIHGGRVVQFTESLTARRFPSGTSAAEYIFGPCESATLTVREGLPYLGDERVCLDPFTEASMSLYGLDDSALEYIYNDRMSTILYKNRAICGILDEYRIPCLVEKDRLTINGESFDISPLSEGLLSVGEGVAVLKRNKITKAPTEDSIKLTATVKYTDGVGTVYRVGEYLISDYADPSDEVGDTVELFYPVSELSLLDGDDNIMLASYLLTGNILKAVRPSPRGSTIRISGRSFRISAELPADRRLAVTVEPDGFYLTDRRRGIEATVINEERSKDFTLCYAYLRGQEEYVVAKLPSGTRTLGEKRIFLGIDTSKIRIL